MLHLDGLADTADGLLPPVDRARRLAIMATPDVGAFGLVALVLVIATRIGSLAALEPDLLLVTGLWAASRAAMAITLAVVPYARSEGGTASGFAGPVSAPAVVTLAAATACLVLAVGGVPGLVTAAA